MAVITRAVAGIRKLASADIIKIFSLTAISTVVKVLTSFVSVKVVSIIIGPVGIALLGQLNNFSAIVLTIATGGIGAGVTRYIAQHNESSLKSRVFLSTAFRITLIISTVCGIGLILFSAFFSKLILLDVKYKYVFIFFGFTLTLYALNNLLISIVNGYKEFKKFVRIGVFDSIVGLLFSIVLVYFYGITGALIGAVTYQSVMFFVTLLLVFKSVWFSLKNFTLRISWLVVKKYFNYTLMTLTTTATAPIAQLIIRRHIISEVSTQQAGWWEAMNRLSGMYLLVITSSFGVYYLPQLAGLIEKKAIKNEIIKANKIVIPILLAIFSVVYLFRDLIIQVLFAKSFYPIRTLFVWQMIGDFFKITSWLFAYLMVAKSKTRMFVSTEIIFSLTYVFLAYFLLRKNGIAGVTQAYMVNYILYFIVIVTWSFKVALS